MLKDTEFQIREVTLLSIEEYEKYQHLIPVLKDLWWLRSPGSEPHCVTFVDFDGDVRESGYIVFFDYNAVRPALRVQSSRADTCIPGDEVDFMDKKWTVLDVSEDQLYVLCDDHIGYHRFDEKSNLWESSKLKDWLETQFSIKRVVTLDDKIHNASKEQHRGDVSKQPLTVNPKKLSRL